MSWKAVIDTKVWEDDKFVRLETQAGRLLWLTLLINPGRSKVVHGVIEFEPAHFASHCSVSIEEVEDALRDIVDQGMAAWDPEAGLVVLRNALKYQRPMNPNHAKGWVKVLDLLPECDILDWYRWQLAEVIKGRAWVSRDLLGQIRGNIQSEPPSPFDPVPGTSERGREVEEWAGS